MIELVENPCVRIPAWVTDLPSFVRWATSDEFPQQGRISFLHGYTWVDLSMETRDHNRVKTQILGVLEVHVTELDLGEMASDRMRLRHPEAALSSEPDGMFFCKESLLRQRVQFEKGGESLEVVGSPDMVLEVVSDTSEQKDTVELLKLYWLAGIDEYWIVDVRKQRRRFDIYRRGAKGYLLTRKQDGWVYSRVFGRRFRLIRAESDTGLSRFVLEMKE
jgi:Uma2 family endonuclease